jgi:tetratricopeptide (TPR) repeat protein
VVDAPVELARLLHSLEKNEEALEVLSGLKTPDAETLLLQADIHGRLGRTDEALADLDAAIHTATESRDLAYRRKGHLLLELDRPKEALAAFDAALGLRPTDPEAWLDAARACQSLGQAARARKMLDEALRLDPEHTHARQLRSESAATN